MGTVSGLENVLTGDVIREYGLREGTGLENTSTRDIRLLSLKEQNSMF